MAQRQIDHKDARANSEAPSMLRGIGVGNVAISVKKSPRIAVISSLPSLLILLVSGLSSWAMGQDIGGAVDGPSLSGPGQMPSLNAPLNDSMSAGVGANPQGNGAFSLNVGNNGPAAKKPSASTGSSAVDSNKRTLLANSKLPAMLNTGNKGDITAAEADGKEMVTDVQILGNKTLPKEKILIYIKTRSGRVFSQETLENDGRTLDNSRLFLEQRTYLKRTQGGVIVIFEVLERPLLQEVKYVGCDKVSKKALEKETELKAGDPLDTFAIEEARCKIEALYKRKGYDKARATLLEGNKPEDRRAIFLINEGVKQKIQWVSFVGNNIASDGRLRTVVQQKHPYLFLFKGELDRKELEEDKKRLIAYYHGLGFLDVRLDYDVTRYDSAEHKDLTMMLSRAGRELNQLESANWWVVTYIIEEGIRFKVRNISVVGNDKFTPEQLREDPKLKPGDYFNQAKLLADRSAMTDVYGSQGYVFAEVKPEPRYLTEPGTLDLVYKVTEGDRYRVGKIDVVIKGEYPHTKITTVLNRLSLRPGDIVDTREIRASERRMRASQLFESNPAQGEPPKIVFSPPDKDDDGMQMAKKPKGGPTTRFQSPEPSGNNGISRDGVKEGTLQLELCGANPNSAPPRRQTIAATYSSVPKGEYREEPSQIDEFAVLDNAPDAKNYFVNKPANEQGNGEEFSRVFDAPATRAVTTAVADPRSNEYYYQKRPVETQMQPQQQMPSQNPVRNPLQNAMPPKEEIIVRGQYTPSVGGVSSNTIRTDGWRSTGPTPIVSASNTNSGTAYAGNGSYPAAGTTSYPATTVPTTTNAASGNAYVPYQGGATTSSAATSSNYNYANSNAAGAASTTYPNNGGATGYTNTYNEGSVPVPQNATPSPNYAQNGSANPAMNPTLGLPGGDLTGGVADPNYRIFDNPGQDPTRLLQLSPTATETQTGRFMLGFGVNSDAGLFGSVVVDEQNFNLFKFPRSWEEVKNFTAWRGAGQQLRIEAVPGTSVQRYSIGLTDPYLFDTQVSGSVNGFYYTRSYSEWYEERVGGRVSLGYQFTPDLSGSLAYRGERVGISSVVDDNVPELAEVLGNNALHGFSAMMAHDTRDNRYIATEGHLVRGSIEQVIGSFQYPRASADLKKFFNFFERPDGSGRHVLSFSVRGDYSGPDTPVYDRYYAGGYSTIRGFSFRGVSPMSSVNPTVHIGGDFMMLASAEYMFPITADDTLRGVIFCDTGTVQPSIDNWQDKYRIAPGFGLRISVAAMGPAPIALDFAFPVVTNTGDEKEMFSFFIGFGRN